MSFCGRMIPSGMAMARITAIVSVTAAATTRSLSCLFGLSSSSVSSLYTDIDAALAESPSGYTGFSETMYVFFGLLSGPVSAESLLGEIADTASERELLDLYDEGRVGVSGTCLNGPLCVDRASVNVDNLLDRRSLLGGMARL